MSYIFIKNFPSQSNIIISILRSNYLSIPNLSKFLEWNFIYCIIDPISYLKPFINNNSSVTGGTAENDTINNTLLVGGDTNSVNLDGNNLSHLGINPDEYIKRVKTRFLYNYGYLYNIIIRKQNLS